MFENNFLNQYGIEVKFEFENDNKENNQDISVIIETAFARFIAREII